MKNIKVFFITKQTILILLFIVGAGYLLDALWKYQLVQHERVRARSTVEKVATCTADAKQGDLIDNLAFCASGVTATPTGGVWAVNFKTKEVVYDSSVSHRDDIIACADVIKEISQGYDSYEGLNVSCEIGGSTKHMEWVFYPSEYSGVNGLIRNGAQEPEQIMVEIGIQEDELFAYFKLFEMVSRLVIAIAFISVLVIHYQRKEKQLNNA